MGKKSRDKGQRNEQQIVNLFKDAGIHAVRVPLSGSCDGFPGDIIIDGRVYEAKIKATGFRQIYSWLADNAGLFLRADRQELLIVVRAKDWIELRGNRPGKKAGA